MTPPPVHYLGMEDKTVTRRLATQEIAYGQMQAGEGIGKYDTVYVDGLFIRRGDASAPGTMPILGLAAASALSGGRLDVWVGGLVSNAGWSFASNVPIFASETVGTLTASTPLASGALIQVIGRSRTPTALHLLPEDRTLLVMSG